jgi:hypothetical protein
MLLKDSSRTKNTQELVTASIDALVKALEAGHSEALSAYLTAMSQFHNYSFQNILLIASQRPTATRVAGIRSWNELGRRVKRGEKGIMIFAPMIGYKATPAMAVRASKAMPKPTGQSRVLWVFVPCTSSMSVRPKAQNCLKSVALLRAKLVTNWTSC